MGFTAILIYDLQLAVFCLGAGICWRTIMFGFTELEEELLGENSEAVLKHALEVVRAVRGEAQTALASGLPQDDHIVAESIYGAATAAESILLTPIKENGA